MYRLIQISSSSARNIILTATILIASGLSLSAFAQEAPGYISPNKSDLPPSLERDDSLRDSNPNRPAAYGPTDAKVLIIEFADFGCPACRRASQAIHQIAYEFPGEVRVEFWNNPLAIHNNADLAALAALAAQRQGKFWEMHDLLFKYSKHDIETINNHAKQLGLNETQFAEDMNDPGLKARIEEEQQLAIDIGARATPGYVINGKVAMGWGSWVGFRSFVERELAAANKLAAQGLSPFEVLDQRAIANNTDSETYSLYVNRVLKPNFENN